MVYNRFIGRDGLKDKRIIEALHKAAEDYENGEVAEVRDLLEEIVWAVDEFEARCNEKGRCV